MLSVPKEQILVYGNCQAHWLAEKLRAVAQLTHSFDITYLPSFGTVPTDHVSNEPGFFKRCRRVLLQTAAGAKLPEFTAALNKDCRQCRFPTLWLKLLWPLHASDPRSVPESGHPYGRYPYGDRLAMKLLNEGVAPDDLPRRYLDTELASLVNLDRFAEISFRELHYNDRNSDIALTPYIEKNFRTIKLFGTVNHPSFAILREILARALDFLEVEIQADSSLMEGVSDILGSEEIPVHPQVVRHFSLQWVSPNQRWRYRSAMLGLEDYLLAYARFTPIPMGIPPELYLIRAREVSMANDFPAAERLLLEASEVFPSTHVFLLYLARLHLREKRWLEAEKILRFALSRHPQIAELHSGLGTVMLGRGFRQEAAKYFGHALALDPANQEARRESQGRR